MSAQDVVWLTADQQHAWRAYLRGTTHLMAQLDRDLNAAHELSLSEYEILVTLSESPDRRMRMAELAGALRHSRSRLTHTVTRMEADGLVVREACDDDRRGVWAQLTDAGFARLVEAAPTHVNGVRRYLVDAVDQDDFAAMGRVFESVTRSVGRA